MLTFVCINIIIVEALENEGCNNGNYPEYTVEFDNGVIMQGVTCRCRCGCSNTDSIINLKKGCEFNAIEDFYEAIE